MTYNGKLKPYKKEYNYSYSTGAYTTIELLENRLQQVDEVYIHSKLEDTSPIIKRCKNIVPVTFNDKIFSRIGINDNAFIVGIFQKYTMQLAKNRPHIVLVNPSDMGNIGTIIRSALGFGYKDLAIISPAADVWHPKSIRASMGALFRMNIQYFENFEAYRTQFNAHQIFTFILGGEYKLSFENCPKSPLFSLVYGNEGAGLDNSFLSVGTAIQIPQTVEVDSLNLAIATSIGAFTFAEKNGLLPLN